MHHASPEVQEAKHNMLKCVQIRRRKLSQECHDPRRHCFSRLMTLTPDPKINGFPGLMVEQFYVKFRECHDW